MPTSTFHFIFNSKKSRSFLGLHPHEQHSATSSAIGEDVRVDGRRETGRGRGKHFEGTSAATKRSSRRSGYAVRKEFGAEDNSLGEGARRFIASYQRRWTGVAACAKEQRCCRGRRGAASFDGSPRRKFVVVRRILREDCAEEAAERVVEDRHEDSGEDSGASADVGQERAFPILKTFTI